MANEAVDKRAGSLSGASCDLCRVPCAPLLRRPTPSPLSSVLRVMLDSQRLECTPAMVTATLR